MRRSFSLLPLAFILGACTHTVQLNNYSISEEAPSKLKRKKVAIVIEEDRINNFIKGGHNVEFVNVADGVANNLESYFERQSRETKVFKYKKASQGYDYYVLPSLEARIVDDYFTKGCLVKIKLEIQDTKMNTIVTEEKERKRSFVTIGQSTNSCNNVTGELFSEITPLAIKKALRK